MLDPGPLPAAAVSFLVRGNRQDASGPRGIFADGGRYCDLCLRGLDLWQLVPAGFAGADRHSLATAESCVLVIASSELGEGRSAVGRADILRSRARWPLEL